MIKPNSNPWESLQEDQLFEARLRIASLRLTDPPQQERQDRERQDRERQDIAGTSRSIASPLFFSVLLFQFPPLFFTQPFHLIRSHPRISLKLLILIQFTRRFTSRLAVLCSNCRVPFCFPRGLFLFFLDVRCCGGNEMGCCWAWRMSLMNLSRSPIPFRLRFLPGISWRFYGFFIPFSVSARLSSESPGFSQSEASSTASFTRSD